MRRIVSLLGGVALVLATLPASAAIIQVSPVDGPMAFTKIEAAVAGDEVVIAPGTYAFRVYLQNQGMPASPIYIHASDPSNPPIWDFGTTLVEDEPGSYGAPDKNRGCWQVSGGTNYIIEGVVFRNCHSGSHNSAGLRYYSGTSGLVIRNCLFELDDNGLTGGTENSDATVEFSEFSQNGNLLAPAGSPTHNAYIFGGTFALRYSYLHDPIQAENLHCRAVTSTIEYNWFDRAKAYVGDLMTSDDYANNPVGSLSQKMILRGNVIIQSPNQANTGQIWAVYNDEASGSPVDFSITASYNTVVGAGGHAAFVHLSNADGTKMTADVSDNVIAGTSQPVLIEDTTNATLSGKANWIQTGADSTGLSASVVGASPGFSNAANDDFTLAAGSASIGAADPSVGGLPADEYYENETVTRMYRVRAGTADIGAFEHDTSGPGIGPGGGTTVIDGGAPDASTGVDAGGSDAGGGVDASVDMDAGMDSGAVSDGGKDGGSPRDSGAPLADASASRDASTPSDAAMPPASDAAAHTDGGAAPSEDDSGCGCKITGVSARSQPLAYAALALAMCGIARRRLRSQRGRSTRSSEGPIT